MEILYSSDKIHTKIKYLFSSPSIKDKRVILVAFIGSDAKSFLPSPKNILIICNPNPIATSPEAISYLQSKGAKVLFSNSLHMKVYYSKQRGCIFTSANLSNNALGAGKLKEVGIYIPSKQVDIDYLVKLSKPYKITRKKLIELYEQSKKIKTALKKTRINLPKENQVDFKEWYKFKEHKLWKIVWYKDEDIQFAKRALETIYANYGKKEPYAAMNFERGQVKENDWLLCFKISPNKIVSKIYWMYIDFIVPLKGERVYNPDYSFQAVQVNSLSKYPAPPFELSQKFKTAFTTSISKYGIQKICNQKKLNPNRKFLKVLLKQYCQ